LLESSASTGEFHTLKEYIIDMRITLVDTKEYWTHDNSGLVCATALQQILYILAKNFGLKSPEKFGILACNRLLTQYNQIEKLSLFIEECPWKRISYDGTSFHNHAFALKSECLRHCTVTMHNKGKQVCTNIWQYLIKFNCRHETNRSKWRERSPDAENNKSQFHWSVQ
jgi:urate oxidase